MSQPTSRNASNICDIDDSDSPVHADGPNTETTCTSGTDDSAALIDASTSSDAGQDTPEQAAVEPQPCFPSVEAWVTGHFVPMYRRTLGGEFRWCSQWWQHAEAISRLTALWYAWEAMRLQGATGISLWHRDHLDHQLPILLGARGPFYQCTESQHLEPHQAITEPAPPGWWETGPHSDPSTDTSPSAPEAAEANQNNNESSQITAAHTGSPTSTPAPTDTIKPSSDDQ